MERKSCFVCAACSYSCPNPGLYEIGEPVIECKDCGENSGQCKDCLFENCEYCPEYKKEVEK